MQEFPLNIRNAVQLKATLGVNVQLYNDLVAAFDVYIKADYETRVQRYWYGDGIKKPSVSPKGKLPTASLQVAFVLYYLKNYMILEAFAERFNMGKGCASGHLKTYLQRLHEVLNSWQVLPRRSFANIEEMQKYMNEQEWKQVFIDVAERRQHRPQDDTEQRALYSSKKKRIP